MMRQLLIVLFLMSGLSLAAQTLSPIDTGEPVAESTPGITAPTRGESDSVVQPVTILRDDSGEENVLEKKSTFLTSTAGEYADEGEFEAAERAYLRALEIDPENQEAQVRLASLYVDLKRHKEAVVLFRSQLELDPDNPLANNNLAWCYIVGPDVRNIPLALRHVREALLTEPRLPASWNTLAEAYYVSGEYEKARRASEYALEMLENIPEAQGLVEGYEAQLAKIKQAQQLSEMLDE